ncbi:MAG TPA: 3-dehydroquinate dehydratase, partial [Clostridiales bacterium]|nr:3-dehydroquinate dehydratase [Clostridiales bacterium]
MKIYILNGPNLNLLGIREPGIYGSLGYDELCRGLASYCEERGIEAVLYQSNHEGDLVDKIQEAYFAGASGIVLNPGAYTHTSIALLDALSAVKIPTVEVHISDVTKRESFRKTSYIRPACVASIIGHGVKGYYEAVDLLAGGKET